MLTLKYSECGKIFNPDDIKCLNCIIENKKAFKQHERCKLYEKHQILKNAGLDSESRNYLSQNNQLIDAAFLAEEGLDKDTINNLAREGRLLESAQAHQILKEAGLDSESRNYLLQKKQLVDVALLVKKDITFGEFWMAPFCGLDKDTLNKLAIGNSLLDFALFIEKSKECEELDRVTIKKLAKRRANYLLNSNQIDKNTINKCSADKDKTIATKTKKARLAERNNLIGEIYLMYLSALRHTRKTISRRKDKRYTRRCRKLGKEDKLLLKGKYIRLIISHCNYLLTLNQLCDMSKKLQIAPKDFETLSNKRIIYRQELNGIYFYAEGAREFKQKWDSQVEYFNKLFRKSGVTKARRLISSLMKNALLEKKWFLDEIYVSILISKVLQIPVDIHESITEEKRKKVAAKG